MTTPTDERRASADIIANACRPQANTSLIFDGDTIEAISHRAYESIDIATITGALVPRLKIGAKTWFRIETRSKSERSSRYVSWLESRGFTPITAVIPDQPTDEDLRKAQQTISTSLKYRIAEGNTILIGSSPTAHAIAAHAARKTATRLVWIYDDMSADELPSLPATNDLRLVPASNIAAITRAPHKFVHDFHRLYVKLAANKLAANDSAAGKPVLSSEDKHHLEIAVDLIATSDEASNSARIIGISDADIAANRFDNINAAIERHTKAI